MKNDNYKKEQEQKRNKRLAEKYEDKLYYIQYQLEYKVSIFFSWVFSVLSGICAFAFMYFVFFLVVPNKILSSLLALIICVGWELLKRHLLITANEDFHRSGKASIILISFYLCIAAGSIVASFYGAKWTIASAMNEPGLIANTTEKKLLQSELKKTEERINQYETDPSYKTGGKTYYNIAQYTIPKLESKRDSLSSKLILVQDKIEETNKSNRIKHIVYRSEISWHYALAVAILDLLLVLTIGYKEYYENREAIEKGLKGDSSSPQKNKPSPKQTNGVFTANYKAGRTTSTSNELDLQTIKKQISSKKGAIRSNKSQIKLGRGDKKTKQAAIEKYVLEIQGLEAQLENMKN